MLSYQRIGVVQWGQRDPGFTMDSPFGMREMQTLRKLPKRSPTINAASWTMPRVTTERVYGFGDHTLCEV